MNGTIGLMSALLAVAQASPATESTAVNQTVAADETKTQKSASAKQAKASTDDDDKIICRRTAIVGSKFKKRICGTKKQWETLANRGSQTTRELQRAGKGLEPGDVPGI
ncbi:MAG: hypothetical protein AAGK01_08775 [Pseudomonadota bacterium]